MNPPYESLMCDCEYYDPPCDYCCSDPLVMMGGKLMRKSEAVAIEKERRSAIRRSKQCQKPQ